MNYETPSQDFFQILGQKFDRIYRRSQGLRMEIIANLCSKFGKKMRKIFLHGGFVIQSLTGRRSNLVMIEDCLALRQDARPRNDERKTIIH
ncbi:MAG: hypothetical protein A3D44_01040 [Candidatus Staskawiczbacteria bacterium RIFCSPHIGHO2_02_FULL_42_22]|uniref:Uncharacterized protein n=1 Tax=Candidatus Staskawiczbacteria bacterium RIFCSPHIGHO2_02_FULL_42_22 TaxID=1802207 RepID=A0A1G2I5D8_9BACT|nr:MAG: hypothetical protein A3D44_01040 [Candidatus Staskawiczbacteria bacterium RIFCSPHIGHO2_02_FULL_42_22]